MNSEGSMEGSSADDKTPRGRNVAHARGANMGGTFPMRSPGKAGAGGGQQQHQHRDKKGHHHYHHSKHNLGTLQKLLPWNLGTLQKLLPWITIGLLSLIALVLLGSALFPGYIFMCPETIKPLPEHQTIKRLPEHCVKLESDPVQHDWVSAVLPFDCLQAPQSSPVIAHRVDDVKYDFFLSLLDFPISPLPFPPLSSFPPPSPSPLPLPPPPHPPAPPHSYIFMCPETIKRLPEHCVKLESDPVQHDWVSAVLPFDCFQAPQSSPVIAHRVDDVKYDFFLSLLDFGTRRRPNRNMVRLMEDRPFLKPELAVAMQSVLEMLIEAKAVRPDSLVIDAGAGIGGAAFAAAAMGVRVLALDPVLANVLKMCDAVHLNRLGVRMLALDPVLANVLNMCDAVHLNRVAKRMKLHLAAVLDSVGNITMHNVSI
ncbi:unnamed protein product [Closterium sp. NIES-65]|nr:unnamed protein product [Closterium sp. NIES-65]